MSGQHYFSDNPDSTSRRSEFSLVAGDRTLTLVTDSGVFSQNGLDKGTSVFLDTMRKQKLPSLSAGSTICDVGCGTGAIALTLAVLFPKCTVLAVDTNQRARHLCEENAERNHLSNVRVMSPEQVEDTVAIELLWSNPPIRIGKDALHALLDQWLSRLTHSGVAHLVVSRNLGADSLAQWMSERGFPTTKLGSSKGFRVLEVKKKN